MRFFLLCMLMTGWLQSMHLPPWVSIYSELPVIFGILLFAFRFFSLKENAQFRVPASFVSLWLGMVFLLLFQYFVGKIYYLGDLIVYLMYLQIAMIALILGFNAKQYLRLMDVIGDALLYSGVVTAVILLIQVSGVDVATDFVNPMPTYRRPGGNLAQPNHAATLLAMSVAVLWERRFLKKISKAFTIFIMILLSLALAITESRTGFLSFLAVSVWFAVLAARARSWVALREIGAAVCIHQLFWWLWPEVFSLYWWIDSGGNSISAISGNLRFLMWGQIWSGVLIQPWIGWGWGQLSSALNEVASKYITSAPFTYSHNVILDVFVGFGIPIGLFFVLLCGRLIWICRILLKWSPVGFFAASLIPPLLHSMLEFPFAYAYFLVPMCLIFGVVAQEFKGMMVWNYSSAIMISSVAVFALVGMQIFSEYLQLEEDFRVARFEALNIGDTPSTYVRPSIILLTQLDAMVKAVRVTPTGNMSLEEVNALKYVAYRFPSIGFQSRYAIALGLNGNIGEARRQLDVIRVMYGDAVYRAALERMEGLQNNQTKLIGM